MSSNHITIEQLRLLSGLLAAPDVDSLATIKELAQEYHWLQAAEQELTDLPLTHWQAEHTRLFINGHPKTCCPPFESVYRHNLMNAPVCDEIKEIYHAAGLEAVEDLSPDYLGMMLECAAYLLEQRSATETSIPPEQIETLWEDLWQKHLSQWVPKFARDLEQQSELRLYQQIGQQLKELF